MYYYVIIFLAIVGILNSIFIIKINKKIHDLQKISGLLICKIGTDDLIDYLKNIKK